MQNNYPAKTNTLKLTVEPTMRPEVMNLLRRLKLAALLGVPAAGLGAAGYYAYKKATEEDDNEDEEE